MLINEQAQTPPNTGETTIAGTRSRHSGRMDTGQPVEAEAVAAEAAAAEAPKAGHNKDGHPTGDEAGT